MNTLAWIAIYAALVSTIAAIMSVVIEIKRRR